ncbi:MAG: PhoH family protein [Lachnospiraceae bacterium]|nr:PhoH family protein [Lachnospiraceae bacterium]
MPESAFDLPSEHGRNIFGQFDANLKLIEDELHVSVVPRNGRVKIIGQPEGIDSAKRLLAMLLTLSEGGTAVTEQNIRYSLGLLMEQKEQDMIRIDQEILIHTMSGRPVKAKTIGQKEYVDSIESNMITFGVGPAGTGKTYLAMAMAIRAFRAEEVSRIILTRPAIEAGEKLGFLPGDLQSKIDPYLRPLYDALYDIMGAEAFLKNSEKGLIEVAPLAYMRGRTLDHAFIILDEAQNTTPSQMKMFLTRIGFGSKVVVTGDRTQKDLPADTVSGLDVALRVLSRIDEIGFCELTSKDVVRHPLVQKIVEAYESYEKSGARREQRKAEEREKRRPFKRATVVSGRRKQV